MSDITPRPWPGNPRLLVTADGSLIGPSGKTLKGRSNGKGYLQVEVSEGGGRPKNVRVHRIVCETWHGPRPTSAHEVAHEDCDKSNNHPDNLRWASYAENRDDMRRHHREGRYDDRAGLPVPCKLSPDDVRAIRAEHAAGVASEELCARFKVTRTAICSLLAGRSYSWVE